MNSELTQRLVKRFPVSSGGDGADGRKHFPRRLRNRQFRWSDVGIGFAMADVGWCRGAWSRAEWKAGAEGGRSLFFDSLRIHRLRGHHGLVVQTCRRAQHSGHPSGLRFARRDATSFACETKSGKRAGQCGDARGRKQIEFCTYLSAILLAGLLLNMAFGLWWADPVAGLIMVPIIAKEGIEGLQGKACNDCCAGDRWGMA